MTHRILMIEDDINTVNLVIQSCKPDLECEIEYALDGKQGLEMALRGGYELMLVDMNLPNLNGLEICRTLRRELRHVPIIFLTSRCEEIDRILGLELGADDYVAKPFSPRELVARIKAVLRRTKLSEAQSELTGRETLTFGKLVIHLKRREVHYDGTLVDLTSAEFDIVLFMASNPGQVLTREQIMDQVLGYQATGYDSSLTTHLSRIRSKLEPDPRKPTFIHTVRGVGYRFAEPAELENV